MAIMATDKQLSYIRGLMIDCGISTFATNRDHEDLPHFDMAYTTVQAWFDNLGIGEASDVIKYLKDLKNDG
jgi:hypothetical protein